MGRLSHCGQEKHSPKREAETQCPRPGDQWDKGILAAGTECPKGFKSRDTEQYNICVVNSTCVGAKSVRQRTGLGGGVRIKMVLGRR